MHLKIECKHSQCTNHACREGFCRAHYLKNILNVIPKQEQEKEPSQFLTRPKNYVLCAVKDCNTFAVTNAYCEVHYNRIKKGLTADGDKKAVRKDTICCINLCEKPLHAKGYCQHHYDKHWRRMIQEKCTIEDCHFIQFSKKVCQKHYHKLFGNRANGDN